MFWQNWFQFHLSRLNNWLKQTDLFAEVFTQTAVNSFHLPLFSQTKQLTPLFVAKYNRNTYRIGTSSKIIDLLFHILFVCMTVGQCVTRVTWGGGKGTHHKEAWNLNPPFNQHLLFFLGESLCRSDTVSLSDFSFYEYECHDLSLHSGLKIFLWSVVSEEFLRGAWDQKSICWVFLQN